MALSHFILHNVCLHGDEMLILQKIIIQFSNISIEELKCHSLRNRETKLGKDVLTELQVQVKQPVLLI